MNFENVAIKDSLCMYEPKEIAKYIRLSLADEAGTLDESESIANQRRILNQFITKNGNHAEACQEFIDDGCSGTNFNRPGWISLKKEVERGKIKVIITKNLSRLGRSNFECGYYLDFYFPENKIRYIALQEQIDTESKENANNEYAALNNFINEKYSKDLSKNIKKVYKIKQLAGEYMGGIPVYGYKKDPTDKHKLIVDEEAADVVKKIYRLYLETRSQNYIRKVLSEEKIPIPEVYKKTRRGLCARYPYEWNHHTIRNILRNQMYIGNMVQNVFSKKSFREKKIIQNKKEDWIIVEKTHEAIIDKETFEKVQILLKANYRMPSKTQKHLFSGLLYCHECGHKIGIGNVKRDREIYRQFFYTYCNYYRKNSTYNKCTPHSMNYNHLEDRLLEQIIKLWKKEESKIDYEKIIEEKEATFRTYEKNVQSKIEKLHIDKKSIDLKMEKTYMDRLEDIISESMYKKVSENLESKKKKIIEEEKEIKRKYTKYMKKNKEVNLLDPAKIKSEYQREIKNGKRDLLIRMIKKIEIHQNKKIDVYFTFKPI